MVLDEGAHIAQQSGDTLGQKKAKTHSIPHSFTTKYLLEYVEYLRNNSCEPPDDNVGKEENPQQLFRTTQGFKR